MKQEIIKENRFRRLFLPAAVFLSGIMLFISFIPVNFGTEESPFLYLAGKTLAGKLCHQNPMKTPEIFGDKILLCSRCSGIYSGAFLTGSVLLLFGIITRKRLSNPFRIPAFLILPAAADVMFYNAGVYDYNLIIAWVTGFLSGSGVILYIWNDFF